MADDNAGDEVARIFEHQRRLALEDTRVWVEALSGEEREQLHMIVGDRTFSPVQILKEIEETTTYGRIFVDQLTAQRLESAKRGGEIDAERRRIED